MYDIILESVIFSLENLKVKSESYMYRGCWVLEIKKKAGIPCYDTLKCLEFQQPRKVEVIVFVWNSPLPLPLPLPSQCTITITITLTFVEG